MADTTDYGPAPFVGSIEDAAVENANYRTTLWTGNNLQVTLMSIEPGHDIGLEVHDTHDQFLRIEAGSADVVMGSSQNELQTWQAFDGDAVIVPAGTWHNLTCAGVETLKVYSIYAPPQHPHGTIHVTKEEAETAEAAAAPVSAPSTEITPESVPAPTPAFGPTPAPVSAFGSVSAPTPTPTAEPTPFAEPTTAAEPVVSPTVEPPQNPGML